MPNYFMGQDGFVWFIGVVEDRNDPSKLGRVKVRCLGFHTEDKNQIPTETLPWAHVMHPVTDPSMQGMGSTPSFLVEGSWVVGFFRDADEKQQPIIMGSLPGYPQEVSNTNIGFNDPKGKYPQKENIQSGHALNESDVNRLARVDKDKPSLIPEKKDTAAVKDIKVADGTSWNEPDSAYDPFYPFNHVYESESGHIKEFDDSVGTERIHEYHRRGTFYEVSNTGDKSTRVIRDNYEVIKRNDFRYVKGDLNLTISGKLNIKCKDFNLDVEDDFNETIGKDHRTNVSGIQATTVNGDVTKTYNSKFTSDIKGVAIQSYENTLTNFHIFNEDTQIEPTVTNHHDANVLHKVTGEVEFNVTTNFEIFSDATVDVSGATVDIDGTTTNINATTIAVNATNTNLVSQDTATGANNGNSVHGSTGPTLTSATAPTTSDFTPQTRFTVFAEDPSEIGKYGTAGGAPVLDITDAPEISSPGVYNKNSPTYDESEYQDAILRVAQKQAEGKTVSRFIGEVSATYESGGRNEATAQDTGGFYSYGRYQLYSKGGDDSRVGEFIKWMKTVAEFRDIAEELDEIGAEAAGSQIESVRQPFIDKWTQISTFQPDLFKKAQHNYIQITHYEDSVQRIKNTFGLDADDGTHIQGLQDAIWSASVQHGPGTNVFKNGFKSLGVPDTKTISEVTDSEIISAFYDERSRTITQTDVDNFPSRYTSADIGKLIYFRNYLTTFPDRQASLEKRYTSEKKDALSLTSIG